MATLADIAKRCSTSTATVSYVINGQGDRRRISPSVQEQIKAVAEELGYRQKASNKPEHALKIGVFWPNKNLETTLTNVIAGINNALLFESGHIELNIVPYGYNSLINQGDLWSSRSYDAAVILFPNSADMQTLTQRHTKMPAVLLNRSLEGYSCVTTDYSEVGRLTAEHAIAKGDDDIVLIHNSVSHIGMNLRSRAVYDVCASYGIKMDEKILYCSNNINEAYELGLRMLREKHLPKVILCMYDTVAFGLVRAFNESGITVGQEVEILTSSTSYPAFFARATPSITVVDMKVAEMTQRAFRLAIDHATGHRTTPIDIIIPPELIYRESSTPPSAEQIKRLIERKRQYRAERL